MAIAALSFEAFTLHPGERRLQRGGMDVPLGPRAFDLLCELTAHPGELLTKDDLLSTVWRGLVVEEANIHVQVSQLRKAIGPDAVVTVPGRGYRFTLPVQAATPPTPTRRNSVIVLPFEEPGAPPEHAYFANAITDDITAELSRIRDSFVVGTPTAMTYRHEAADLWRFASELGVRYALQGRLERDESGVEVSARLYDTRTGAIVWSDTIELPLDSVRRIRKELVARLANALELQLVHAQAQRSAAQNSEPDVVDLIMQGRDVGGWNWSQQDYANSIAFFDRALAIAPDDADALAWRADARVAQAAAWPGPDLERLITQAERDALHALRVDPQQVIAHVSLAVVRNMQFRRDEASMECDVALDLEPNSVRALHLRAEIHRLGGRADLGLPYEQRGLDLSPRDPHLWCVLTRMGWLHIHLGDYEAALGWLQRAQALQSHWAIERGLIAMHANLGHIDRARELVALQPEEFTRCNWNRVSDHPDFLEQMRRHYFPGLRKAGALPYPGYDEEWLARQRRGAAAWEAPTI
jgi:TolB-like protein